MTSTTIRKPIFFLNEISLGNWLNQEYSSNDFFTQSVIAATVWFIWKARCKKIFSNNHLNIEFVPSQAIGHVREYLNSSSVYIGKNFISNYLSFVDSTILITVVIFNEEASFAGCGFLVIDY